MKQTNITKKLWLAAFLVALLTALLCLSAGAETYSGNCGADGSNVTWSLDTETSELTISGTGAMADYSNANYAPWWYSYRSLINTVTIDNSVTSIGEQAFFNCYSLTSVTIGNSVTSIGSLAFACCDILTSVTIGNSVTSIGDEAFYYCSSLTSVTIPDSATGIGNEAFCGCTSLTSVTIGNSVTSIGDEAFYYCSSLTSVTIPDSVTSIGDKAFYSCDKLVEVYNRSTLSITKGSSSNGYVGYYALNVYTPTSGESKLATTEDGYIFYEDGAIVYLVSYTGSETDLTLPGTYNGKNYAINRYAFYNCDNLTSVTIPDSVTSIGSHAFHSCNSLTSVTIPDSVTSIGDEAFLDCYSLTSVTIGNSVTSIGEQAFFNCYILTSVTIPDSVTSIGAYAFYDCDNLTSVTIPDSVTSIGAYAFYSCDSLTSVTILSKNVSIDDASSTFPTSATICGYAGSTAEAYAEKYSRFFMVLEEPEEPEGPMDSSVVAYQVTKNENGEFSLRAIAGVNSLNYYNFGYEVTITTKDEDGNDVVQKLSGVDTKVYSSIYGGGKRHSIKDNFGYEYGALATVTGLALGSEYTKLEIRAYVTTKEGDRIYGNGATLLYTGELNESGYPDLSFVTE